VPRANGERVSGATGIGGSGIAGKDENSCCDIWTSVVIFKNAAERRK
jgi:hypothetical protein